MMVALFAAGVYAADAQTPVEKVILKYENVSGAKEFVAQGGRMALARSLLKRTPVAPVASDVSELAVLKMENASRQSQLLFERDLKEALKDYEYRGRQDSKNGMVDIYVLYSGKDKVRELVIYNSAILSLNSLYGSFSVDSLLELEK